METMRRIYNPIQKDFVTFLKTHDETNGEYSLVEVELAPKGGVGLHYHKTYSETFEVLEGELNVQLGNENYVLHKGEIATAEKNVKHRFYNTSNQVSRFRVTLRPASKGFEDALVIGYALARDGKTDAKGFPKDKYSLAYLFNISESYLPGWMSLIQPLLRSRAKKAVELGIDKELRQQYLTK